MRYRTRLYLGFGLIIMVVTVLLIVIVGMFNNQHEEINNLVEDRYEKIKLLNHIRVNVKSIDRELNEYIQFDLDEESLQRVRDWQRVVNEDLNTLNGIIKIKDAKEQLSDIHSQINAYETTIEKVISFAMIEDLPRASSLYSSSINQFQEIIETSERLISIQETIMEDTLRNANHSYSLYVQISLSSIFIALLLGFGVSHWVIRNITTRFRAVRNVMNSIQYGSENLPRIKVWADDEIGEIAQAYNKMAAALEEHERTERQYTEEIEEQNWLSMKLAELSMLSQGILDIRILGDRYLQEIVPMIDAQYGALYIFMLHDEDERVLHKVSTYAGVEKPILLASKDDFRLGEGLIGQCAKDGKPKLISDIPPNYISISSGLGEANPNSIFILPIILDDEVVGVLELASLSEFYEIYQKLIIQATNQLGVAIFRIKQQMKERELLEQSQALNEELQSQSEELQVQQEELKMVNEELEAQYKHSEQKTKDLEDIRIVLEEKTKQLQLNSKYKSEFLANMSHELRTPLNSLLIFTQILLENKENNLNEKQKEYMETIFAAGKDLLYLINDILDLAKIESGKVDVQLGEMNLDDVLASTKSQFSILAEEKKIDFQIEVYPDVPNTIFTDEHKVLQILKNLISNAIKFTEKGYVKLEVKKERNQSQSYISFKVMDTGIGISSENKQFIFEAFQQADGTTSRKYGGTGLGLSISKELAQILNGYITVASTEGEGSIFTLFLPLSTANETETTRNEVAITTDTNPQLLEQEQTNKIDDDLADKSVLIVDDDMRNIFSLTTALEGAGMKVSFAENGKEALEFLSDNNEVDIVLMDIMMPEMDGYEAMKRIREMDELKQLPIVALTAKAMSNDRKKCIDAGASDYITKPVNMEQLYSLLKVWLYK